MKDKEHSLLNKMLKGLEGLFAHFKLDIKSVTGKLNRTRMNPYEYFCELK